MAHTNQDRWSSLVDAKLRTTLVTRDNLIFNTRYEGSPKAGKVKIPVRDTEVEVKAYSKSAGIDPAAGTTTYLDLTIDQDEAVNELIDGFDAASVPDGIVADRLDSAGYSLGLSMDKKSINALESAADANISATKTACTSSTAYKTVLEAKRTLSRNGVPSEGRWLIAAPEFLEVLMQDSNFIRQGDLSQELIQQGVVGRVAGFNVVESCNMDYDSTTRVASKKTTTEFIAGHPNWCHRVGRMGGACPPPGSERLRKVHRCVCGPGAQGLRHQGVQGQDPVHQADGDCRLWRLIGGNSNGRTGNL